MAPPEMLIGKNIVFYDAQCGVCNALASQLIPAAKAGRFFLGALQGKIYAEVLRRHPALEKVDSVVALENFGSPGEKVYVRGNAIQFILDRLDGAWIILRYLMRLIPEFLQNGFYDFFALHRTRFVRPLKGERSYLPGERELFID